MISLPCRSRPPLSATRSTASRPPSISAPHALSRQDHEWLTERIGHLGQLWQNMDFPHLPG